ncbi:hypothetical protein BCM14_1728 [Jezberella montanilacus]|uniref:Uncharacterized protein n=1 Tax=Jezberella montanilacus TaxID=323426 RepID=A0A2T0XGI0_9BURK|nr:hypothetical protein BCM14_1728 [Jezberella montanilacus]
MNGLINTQPCKGILTTVSSSILRGEHPQSRKLFIFTGARGRTRTGTHGERGILSHLQVPHRVLY